MCQRIPHLVCILADKGLIGIAYASSPFQTTAPYGSNEALYCTNPVAYGIPTGNGPIILDMTTSKMTYYGLVEAKTAHRLVAEDTGYDRKGKPTRSPADIMSGALKTFGGHRGSGLALIGQIFAGAWVRADSFDNDSENAGNLVMAIDPELLTPKKTFMKMVSAIVKRIKAARKLKGVAEILIPGERGDRLTKKRMETGVIEIENNLLRQLQDKVNTP